METFRQYWDSQQPPAKVKSQALKVIDNAAKVALFAKQGDPSAAEQIESQLDILGNLHKELDKYSSHELKAKIVKTYNKVGEILKSKQTATAENLTDCVDMMRFMYRDLLSD